MRDRVKVLPGTPVTLPPRLATPCFPFLPVVPGSTAGAVVHLATERMMTTAINPYPCTLPQRGAAPACCTGPSAKDLIKK